VSSASCTRRGSREASWAAATVRLSSATGPFRISRGEFGVAEDDQGAWEQPRVADALAQFERMPELPDGLLRADVFKQVVEAEVPVNLRAAVPVAAGPRPGVTYPDPVAPHRYR